MKTKVVTLVYYHPMARFFCAIEDAWKQLDPDVEFLHLAVFPSAWAYFRLHGRATRALSWKAFLTRARDRSTDPDVISALIRFHSSDPGMTDPQRDALDRQARAMLEVSRSVIEQFDPDVAILSGDTRLPAEVLMRTLADSRATTWFFEQGPYRTTLLDREGVNANCSFRTALADLPATGPELVVPNQRPRWNNRLYSIVDKFIVAQSRLTGLLPPDLRPYRLEKCPSSRYKALVRQSDAVSDRRKTLLLAMQVPEDANNIYHNPLQLSDAGLIEFVMSGIPPDWKVVVREHPLYRRKYSAAFYALVERLERIELSGRSLSDDIARTCITVTVNSLTGLDAFAAGHRVIVLGESFYDHLNGILPARTPAELGHLVEHPTDRSKPAPNMLLGSLVDRYFFPGHFTDVDLGYTRGIAARVMESLRVETR
ncbi:capsular polysaccharide export protein, LipB/KpsS family [Paraburkholderia phytofirmans]|uniref:capsular polysaccharide export protein, LipB/KpsS family n=1 Tax=Paraburkholderia phytofirmans TaxID=261302 RepID=UPI0038B6F8D3